MGIVRLGLELTVVVSRQNRCR